MSPQPGQDRRNTQIHTITVAFLVSNRTKETNEKLSRECGHWSRGTEIFRGDFPLVQMAFSQEVVTDSGTLCSLCFYTQSLLFLTFFCFLQFPLHRVGFDLRGREFKKYVFFIYNNIYLKNTVTSTHTFRKH